MTAWWTLALVGAGLALVGVYAYAAAALWAHARLARLDPPRSLAHALVVGALMPACGCTALAYARRAPERLRAPFLVASYALNPLLVLAAGLVAGWRGAIIVAGLALLASLAASLLPPGERPRTRLDDLLLRRDASALRDAAPYAAAYAAPAVGVGALVGASSAAPGLLAGAAIAALAFLLAPPHRDIAEDHGPRLARHLRALFALFALAAGALVALR